MARDKPSAHGQRWAIAGSVAEPARALVQHGAEEVRRMRCAQVCTAAPAKLPAAARASAEARAKSAAWKVAVVRT